MNTAWSIKACKPFLIVTQTEIMTHENEQETSPLIFSGFEPGLNAQHELVMTLNRYFFISSRGQTENHPMVSQDSSRRVELAQSCFISQNASSAAVFSPPLLRGEPGSCRNSLESLNAIKKGELSQRIQLSCWLDRPERIPACWGCGHYSPCWLTPQHPGRKEPGES